jgi:hypothetical protein
LIPNQNDPNRFKLASITDPAEKGVYTVTIIKSFIINGFEGDVSDTFTITVVGICDSKTFNDRTVSDMTVKVSQFET